MRPKKREHSTLGYFDDDLPRVVTQGGTSTTFTLDADGRRSTQSTVDGTGTTTTTRRYTDGGDNPTWVDVTAPGAGTTTTRFTEAIGGDLSATIASDGGLILSLGNPHGDVVTTIDIPDNQAATTPATAISGWASYDEYGNTTTADPIDGTLGYGWLGSKQRSTSTATAGLTLMGVRLYNATRGLFTSLDPIPGGNDTPYNYPSDPLNSFDLDGRYSWSRIWGNGLRWGRRHRTRIESGIVSAGAMFAAGMNRSRCRRIHGLMTCTGGRVPLYSRAGTTYGSVYFTNNERKNRLRKRINHEKAHSRQWRRHGFAFAALYLRAGRNPCRNRYEREAGWKSGGYLNC